MIEPREPTFACGMCGCAGEFYESWDLCEHCSQAPGAVEFLRRTRERPNPMVGRLYRAQLSSDLEDWSYVLVGGQVDDSFVCHRVALLIDDTSVLHVKGEHLSEIPLLTLEDFNDV